MWTTGTMEPGSRMLQRYTVEITTFCLGGKGFTIINMSVWGSSELMAPSHISSYCHERWCIQQHNRTRPSVANGSIDGLPHLSCIWDSQKKLKHDSTVVLSTWDAPSCISECGCDDCVLKVRDLQHWFLVLVFMHWDFKQLNLFTVLQAAF